VVKAPAAPVVKAPAPAAPAVAPTVLEVVETKVISETEITINL
jgi:hypothetical protein